jgi:hypothetical protein
VKDLYRSRIQGRLLCENWWIFDFHVNVEFLGYLILTLQWRAIWCGVSLILKMILNFNNGSYKADFFNPSNRTMTLGSTQPLPEMSTINLPEG